MQKWSIKKSLLCTCIGLNCVYIHVFVGSIPITKFSLAQVCAGLLNNRWGYLETGGGGVI